MVFIINRFSNCYFTWLWCCSTIFIFKHFTIYCNYVVINKLNTIIDMTCLTPTYRVLSKYTWNLHSTSLFVLGISHVYHFNIHKIEKCNSNFNILIRKMIKSKFEWKKQINLQWTNFSHKINKNNSKNNELNYYKILYLTLTSEWNMQRQCLFCVY